MVTAGNTEYYGLENPVENDTTETPNVGDTITVSWTLSSVLPNNGDVDQETRITVNEDMIDSWRKWGNKYDSFEHMLLSEHTDDVMSAMEAN